MKESTQQFAQRIRSKYPGAYDDKPDEVLVKAYLQKYPTYADRVDFATNKASNPALSEKQVEKPKKNIAQELRVQPFIGAAKGAGSTAFGLGKAVSKPLIGLANILGKGVNKITGKQTYTPITSKVREQIFTKPDSLKPTNTGQKIGFGAEQIGEFFIPGGAVTKGAKAVQGAKVFSQAPKLAKAAGFGTKVAGEALSMGGVTALQGGDKAQTKSAMILSAAFPVFGKSASKLANTKIGQYAAKSLMEKIPSRMMNSLIRPREAAFSFGKNPGLAIADEGIVANTRGGLLQRITKKKQEIGQAIEQELTHPNVANKIIDVTPAIQTLDATIQKAAKTGDQTLVRRLLDIKKSLTKEFELVGDDLVEKGVRNLQLTPLEAQKLKREIGEATRWTGQAFDADANKARVAVYRAIDSLIDDAVPNISKLNSRYANMLTAEKELLKTNKHLQRLAAIGLKQGGIGAAFGLYSGLSGDSTGTAIAKGLGAVAVSKGLGSTAVKTRVAKQAVKTGRLSSLGKKANMILKGYLGGRKKRNDGNSR